MEGFESGFILLELKYCERCGGLWLRPRESELLFCGKCAKAMAGLLLPGNRTVVELGAAVMPQSVEQSAFWSEGGNA
jgi:hypothetical protein